MPGNARFEYMLIVPPETAPKGFGAYLADAGPVDPLIVGHHFQAR